MCLPPEKQTPGGPDLSVHLLHAAIPVPSRDLAGHSLSNLCSIHSLTAAERQRHLHTAWLQGPTTHLSSSQAVSEDTQAVKFDYKI